jgi:hypothetical protein
MKDLSSELMSAGFNLEVVDDTATTPMCAVGASIAIAKRTPVHELSCVTVCHNIELNTQCDIYYHAFTQMRTLQAPLC